MLYRSVKITLGVMVAIILSEFIGLEYGTTAGVITMLSIFDTRKQTYIIGMKRILFSGIAILFASVVFWFASHSLFALGIFLLCFTLLLTWLKSLDAWAISTVLVSHIYTLQEHSVHIIFNEFGLVLVGVIVAWILNLHMPNRMRRVKEYQDKVEAEIKHVLKIMRLRLLNQCSVEDRNRGLKPLDELLDIGLKEAIDHNNNYIFSDNSYYIYYFQMRRQQFLLLMHMDKYLERMFITVEQAKPLSDFTGLIADEFAENNTGLALKEKGKNLLEYYRSTPLPTSREEFESRAVLFRYLSDLIEFVDIKIQFSENFK